MPTYVKINMAVASFPVHLIVLVVLQCCYKPSWKQEFNSIVSELFGFNRLQKPSIGEDNLERGCQKHFINSSHDLLLKYKFHLRLALNEVLRLEEGSLLLMAPCCKSFSIMRLGGLTRGGVYQLYKTMFMNSQRFVPQSVEISNLQFYRSNITRKCIHGCWAFRFPWGLYLKHPEV